MIEVGSGLFLDERELEERFVRASGPGGQNVNKVATAVELRFNWADNASLPDPIHMRLAGLAGRRLNKEGVLVIRAHRHRLQEDNRRDAWERLRDLILAAAVPPPPPRRPTKTPRAQKRARLNDKRARGQAKTSRRKPDMDD